MAQATTKTFGKGLIVMLGDGATPEVFAAPCGITERGFTLSNELQETQVPDCTDEDAPSWTSRDKVSRSASINSSGVMAVESIDEWRAAYMASGSVSFRVFNEGNLAAGGGHWSGKFHISSLEFSSAKGGRVELSIQAESDGPVVWTPAAA
jgi:predicted secreted protein